MDKGCRNCRWLYHMVTYNPTAPCSECVDHDKWSTMKQTNADRIRNMTDEELADYLDGVCHDLWQMFVADPQKMWLDWLKREANK